MFHVLIDDLHIYERLQDREDSFNRIFATTVLHIVTQPPTAIYQFLESIPSCLTHTSEHRLLCCAVNSDASGMVRAILEQRTIIPDQIKWNCNGGSLSLLERASSLQHVNVVRTLLEFHADPNLCCCAGAFSHCLDREPRQGTISDTALDTITLLLRAGTKSFSGLNLGSEGLASYTDTRLHETVFKNITGPRPDVLITSSIRHSILTCNNKDTVVSILNSMYTWKSSSPSLQYHFKSILGSSLAHAIVRHNMAAFDILVGMGVEAKTVYLWKAVNSNNLTAAERLLDLGIDPNDDRKSHENGSEVRTALALAISKKRFASLDLFQLRGFVTKASLNRDPIVLPSAFLAACHVGDERWIDTLLNFTKVNSSKNCHGEAAFRNAIRCENTKIIEKLMSANIHTNEETVIETLMAGKKILAVSMMNSLLNLNHWELRLGCPLLYALRQGNLQMFKDFIDFGLPVNSLALLGDIGRATYGFSRDKWHKETEISLPHAASLLRKRCYDKTGNL